LSPIRPIRSRLDSLDGRPRRSSDAVGVSGGGKTTSPPASPWIGALIRVSSTHAAMTRILDVIERLQDHPYRSNFLLVGEPGTGKDGLARALHQLVAPGAPLVRLDVAGFPEEAALAAFSGSGARPGAAEQADRGTLLIEELLGLPPRVQEALLRVLKAGRCRRLGHARDVARRLAVNAIALSDGDVERAVNDGRLRHDLYYRLARIVLWLPPLRERPDDIEPAAVWMGNRILSAARVPLDLRTSEDLRRASEQERRRAIELEPSALEALRAHPWPGNFRELETTLERALLLYRQGSRVGAAQIQAALAGPRP
jgi:DNA-binding NtrC family response regulator